MRYGNTPKSILPAIQMMLLVGGLSAVIGVIVMIVRGNYERWYIAIVLFLIPPVGILAALIPTLFFCIKLEDGYAKHVFLNRYILSQYPVADFVELEFGRSGGLPKIRFTKHRTIYFYGAHLRIFSQLDKDLQSAKKAAKDASARARA